MVDLERIWFEKFETQLKWCLDGEPELFLKALASAALFNWDYRTTSPIKTAENFHDLFMTLEGKQNV